MGQCPPTMIPLQVKCKQKTIISVLVCVWGRGGGRQLCPTSCYIWPRERFLFFGRGSKNVDMPIDCQNLGGGGHRHIHPIETKSWGGGNCPPCPPPSGSRAPDCRTPWDSGKSSFCKFLHAFLLKYIFSQNCSQLQKLWNCI